MNSTDWTALKHLLTSNIAPLPHEYDIAQKIVNELDTELTTLDERVTSLQNELKELEGRRPIIEDRRHRCAGVISARRRIPPEVTQIIMDVLWEDKREEDAMIIEPSLSPIPRLMLVSREWYNIALATPHFWAGLYLGFGYWLRAGVIIKCAERWLSRAQNHPLSLSVRIEERDEQQHSIVRFLEQWAPRIVLLRLNGSHYRDDSIPKIIWPELHTLSISGRLYPLMGGEIGLQFADHKSSPPFPALRRAEVEASILAPCFSAMGIPWGNLVSLKVHFTDSQDNGQYFDMLRECSGRLEEFSIHVGEYIPLTPQSPVEPIIFPRVARLCINSQLNLAKEEWIVGFLRLPALQSITYYLPPKKRPFSRSRNPMNVIINLIQCSKATTSVRYLELYELGQESSSWFFQQTKRLFEEVPNLEVFRMAGSNVSSFLPILDLPQSVQRVEVDATSMDATNVESLLKHLAITSSVRRQFGGPLDIEVIMSGRLVRITG